MVRFDAPAAEGEAEADARSVGASLLERAEQFVGVPSRQTAAFVLDLDQDPLGAGADPQRDGGSRSGELEGVLQDIHHDGREDLPVRFDRQAIFDRHHRKLDALRLGRQRCGRHEFVDERGHEELLRDSERRV